MDFLKRVKDRSPQYEKVHEEMITRFTVVQGGRAGSAAEGTSYEQGKFFLYKYEIFMYASLLGLKSNYNLPLTQEADKKTTFIPIRSWQPTELAEYVIMGVLGKSPLDFYELESKDEKAIESAIRQAIDLMEEYANGGFDMIRGQLEKDPGFFQNNENCFIDLLDQYDVHAPVSSKVEKA